MLTLLVAAIAGGVWEWPEIEARWFPADPLVATPKFACAEVQAHSLYFNGLSLPWLEKLRPDLLTAEDRDAGSPRRSMDFSPGEAHAHEALDNAEHAPLALEHLRRAVADPLLPAGKRKFAGERIAVIRERTGLK